MEIHRELPNGIEPPDLTAGPHKYFAQALKFVLTFYKDEYDRIGSVRFDEVDEDFFFRDVIWVIHATGFSAKAVGKFMPRLVEAYSFWDKCANRTYEQVLERVKSVCNNPQKIRAIHKIACLMNQAMNINNQSWADFKNEHLSSPEKLVALPYIGKITCYHLARNIGLLECVKPDLHLVRMAKYWGFNDCTEMCKSVQAEHLKQTGEYIPLGIVDLVEWFSASTFGTIQIRCDGDR